jgi:beta-galactosidase
MERWDMGIKGPVKLIRIPPAALKDVDIQTSWREKQLRTVCTLDLTQPISGARIEGIVFDADGKEALRIKSKKFNLDAGEHTQVIDIPWLNPTCWELEDSYLYKLQLQLVGSDDEVLDSWPEQQFGFREIWTEGRYIYLNGHISRWRIEWTSFGLNTNSIPLLKLLGRNVVYLQNNPTSWWCDWTEIPTTDDNYLNMLDEAGIGMLMSAPNVYSIRSALLNDPAIRLAYERETAYWVKRFREHPSVLAWSISMNTFNSRDAIHPTTMGQRSVYTHPQAKVLEEAAKIVKANDPTRLVYGHADGNLTDISTANNYPNFMPLQEMEDYPEIYAKKGNMPYFAAETALPYSGSWYKKGQFFGTEYAAIYFGDDAYAEETNELLNKTAELAATGHGKTLKQAIPYFPMYWDVRRLMVTSMDKAWRTWGIQGWHYFNFGVGYGNPPGKRINIFSLYAVLEKPVTEKPEWANPNYDIHSVNMQSLLVYLAGAPTFTDKTHTYEGGENISKQIAVVWDGPGQRKLTAKWQLQQGETILDKGIVNFDLQAGDITFMPIDCTAPIVKERTDLQLVLNIFEDNTQIKSDSIDLTIFNKQLPLKLSKNVCIWDPIGKTMPWVKALGVKATPITPDTDMSDISLLIVGREALTPGVTLPWTPTDIKNGLQVLICEQQPKIWKGLGFIPDDLQSRRVFMTNSESPILAGLNNHDLSNWRDNTDLLPSFKREYAHDAVRAPKGSNRNTVASVVFHIPSVVGFTPLLACEFDLDYTPLLQWHYGLGGITYCSLDLSTAVGHEPVATRLAANLLQTLAQSSKDEPTRTTCITGNADSLTSYAIDSQDAITNPEKTLLIVESNAPLDNKILDAVREGATAVVLPRSADDLTKAGYSVREASLYHAPVPKGRAFRTIGPRLLRWRNALKTTVFTMDGQPSGSTVYSDGLFLIRHIGKGELRFIQASGDELAAQYADNKASADVVRTSVFRLQQLWARFMTNAGATPSVTLASRLCQLQSGAAYEPLRTWFVLGPFYLKEKNAKKVLDTVLPGEKAAIAGDTNPNMIYNRADGTQLDFRKTVTADSDGFVNIGAELQPDRPGAIAYVTRIVDSPMAREATLRLGVDYFMRVWCNGEMVYDLDHGHSSPQPNRHIVNINLKKGENVITIKVMTGSKGFGVWSNLSTPGIQDQSEGPVVEVPLYPKDINFFDPYEYHYW